MVICSEDMPPYCDAREVVGEQVYCMVRGQWFMASGLECWRCKLSGGRVVTAEDVRKLTRVEQHELAAKLAAARRRG